MATRKAADTYSLSREDLHEVRSTIQDSARQKDRYLGHVESLLDDLLPAADRQRVVGLLRKYDQESRTPLVSLLKRIAGL